MTFSMARAGDNRVMTGDGGSEGRRVIEGATEGGRARRLGLLFGIDLSTIATEGTANKERPLVPVSNCHNFGVSLANSSAF